MWYIYTKRADFTALSRKYGISPVTARIMINRGIAEENFETFLHGTVQDLPDPFRMTDMRKACESIRAAIRNGKKIRIAGDYDVDGVCSTYLLVKTLREAGADVSWVIPDRVRDGYGINVRMIEEAARDGIGLIVTCDNGISAAEAAQAAADYGMDMVVTDHHEVPEILPAAAAVVDPKRRDDSYPFREICGGTVAWKLCLALESCGWPERITEETDIVFAAIATVGDIMPLTGENRIIVKTGLGLMPEIRNTGLRKLIEVCGLDIHSVSAYHIGFVLGPCINAAGRLESAELALRLFLEEDEQKAGELAVRLKELNNQRKQLTEISAQKAIEEAAEKYPEDAVKVIYLEGCHESLAGIIAGRVKEAFNHPAIVFTDAEGASSGPDGSQPVIKGSARSIEAYSIFEKLQETSDLLLRFGGHRLAAGMSLEKAKLEEFRKRLNASSGLTEEDFLVKEWIDLELPFEYATLPLCEELKLLEPWGRENDRPAFALRNVAVRSARAMGRNHNVVKLAMKSAAGTVMDGIIFTDADEALKKLAPGAVIDILYYPQVNEYMGRTSVQAVIKDWKVREL